MRNAFCAASPLARWMYSFLCLAVTASCSYADVRLPKLVGDHMVLQRDQPLPIWGWAEPGETVKITFQNKTYTATPDASGKWTVTLPKMSAGGPYAMTIAGKNTIRIQDILIGDVWLASGQSNMEWKLSQTVTNYEQEAAAANFPKIRSIDVADVTAFNPRTDIETDGWQVCNPQSVLQFSAVAYFFVRDLHRKYNVPMGIIASEWGGTSIESWISPQALQKFPEFETTLTDIEKIKGNEAAIDRQYEADRQVWENAVFRQDRGLTSQPAWWSEMVDTKSWKTMELPQLWEGAGLPNYDGIVWFRKDVTIPANQAGKDLTLHLGPIDDADSTWFNGVTVGSMNAYDKPRTYTVPGKCVKAGKNVIAVCVTDTGGGGGLWGAAAQMRVEYPGGTVSLAGKWAYETAMDIRDMPKRPQSLKSQNTATVLYNAMIAPLVPYAIKGAIWYQGESNAARAYQYRQLFPAMITDWRTQWGYEFPFLFVQLANYKQVKEQPVESDWAELREAQSMTLSLPKTGMATIIDIGNADDIHPRNKQDVGKRLALAAQKIAYDENNVVYSGPTYQSMNVEDDKIRLTFDNVGGGLMAKGGKLQEFAIAGADKKFVWADAKIDGNTIVVSSPKIKQPVAVRYAWADNPSKANLYNQEGLPASPFRTDTWQGITVGMK